MTKTLRFSLVLLFSFFFLIEVKAQVLPYAKEVVQKLSSEDFIGRGYVEKGDKIAAEFIRDEYKRLGLLSYTKDYFQKFDISVNTFPKEIKLEINGQKLNAGYDYLVSPESPSVKGTFDVVPLSIEEIMSDQLLGAKLRSSAGKFIVTDSYNKEDFDKEQLERIQGVIGFLKYHPNNPAAGTIELTSEKLTWHGAQQQYPKPSFTVFADSVDIPITKIKVDLKPKLEKKYETQNVVGYIEGENQDSLIVIMAHYDHFGKMGGALFPGANDNASGTAMLMSLARHFSEIKPPFNMAFIAFGGEEIGLLGSKYFVENPLFDLSRVKFLLNFDLAGTGDEGIQVVNGSVYRDQFDQLSKINEEQELLPQVKIRGAACNSDHCAFDEVGVPGFYIYTLGGIRAYHDVYDRYETLPFTEFKDYFTLMVEFISNL
ncbi:MAG: M28 family peptidase [Balneolaceae bacterium]|nr:M28 family peptidase [Balneolaceae bacterium]MBO6546335.1 M28 family peptidase [Balneolaceae bacterium]MBO6648694.1 M28 family peptidase [Balneolaceae bacterium]